MNTDIIISKAKRYMVAAGTILIEKRVTITAVVILFSVGSALLITRAFIDIPRNETRFSEEALLIKYKSIDEDILADFEAAGQDGEVEVNSNFNPDRNNPFSE